ncbi:hypothetical protein HPE39_17520 [Escherichia coli]|nr:hypothetical protein HPE39_17520 [Escherichia coli]
MSGEKKAKGWRFYGLVGFGAIALLSAGVWALQYAGSGPEKNVVAAGGAQQSANRSQ